MLLDCRLIVGTRGSDILVGTSACDAISGCSGDDIITGLGGNDVLVGDGGADRFTYSALTDANPPATGHYHDGVDTVLFFSRADGDRVDLSDASAGLEQSLRFSGTTPEPYGVYYAVGVDPQYDIVAENGLYPIVEGDPITLMADLDGDPQSPEIMAVLWGGDGEPVTHLTASDLIL